MRDSSSAAEQITPLLKELGLEGGADGEALGWKPAHTVCARRSNACTVIVAWQHDWIFYRQGIAGQVKRGCSSGQSLGASSAIEEI
jgi:hypothetical protein